MAQRTSSLVAQEDSIAEALAALRVLVVHDWLVTWAGSERCVEEIVRIFPDADLVVGVRSHSMRHLNDVTRRARETWLARLPGARMHHRWFLPLQGLAFASVDTSPYDLIVSSSHAFSKAVRHNSRSTHVCYCYSPPRYLWDLRATYFASASSMQRAALSAGTRVLRSLDRRAAEGVDHFVGISHYIAERIGRCYGRTADVVYPPVAAKPLAAPPAARREFLLHLGRLVAYKRVDLAIHAAERLGIPLVVAGDGPDRARLERLAGRHTEFVGEVSEHRAAELLSTCAALVFCAEEDFGIVPVEANAHGAPVVGYARGGLLETMIPGVTAEFFDTAEVHAVCVAIERALSRRWDAHALHQNAGRFAPSRFREDFRATVIRALARPS